MFAVISVIFNTSTDALLKRQAGLLTDFNVDIGYRCKDGEQVL
jgi:hypothetical protein